MAQPSNILYIDAIDHLRYNYMGGDLDAELRDIKEAIQTAYRELAFDFSWKYYRTHGRVKVIAPYSTGTISSSGTTVTLTGGTWSAAIVSRYGTLLVDSVCYQISSYTDSTHLELTDTPITAFSADTYVIFQDRYPLPVDFKAMDAPLNEAGSFGIRYVTPADGLVNNRNIIDTGQARRWTLLPDPDFPGGMALVVAPYPSTATTIDFLYVRQPRQLRRSGLETASKVGTITTTAASGTVTGSTTTFSSDMVGSFLRAGTSASSVIPSGLSGAAPYTDQRRIITYSSATSVVCFPTWDDSLSAGTGYLVSDPIDLWPGMMTAFYRRCELELAIARNKDVNTAQGLYQRALSDARDRDAMVLESMRAGEQPERSGFDSYTVDFT